MVVVDTNTGRTGTVEEFVDRFAAIWAEPRAFRDSFLDALSPDIRLVSPGVETIGRVEGLAYLHGVFDLFPDIVGIVHAWAERNDRVFIQMRFRATIGTEVVEWPNVDVFRFVAGVAVERVAYFDPTIVANALARSS